ncbi:hypothetical protein ACPZ19_19070 [Amycolatopsis lurida]
MCEVGQLVEQAGVGRAWLLVLLLGDLQRGQRVPAGGLLVLEFVVGLAEALGERVVGVAGPGLSEDGSLLAVRVGDQPLQTFPLGFAFADGAVVESAEVGEEAGGRIQKGVLADPDTVGWPASCCPRLFLGGQQR